MRIFLPLLLLAFAFGAAFYAGAMWLAGIEGRWETRARRWVRRGADE